MELYQITVSYNGAEYELKVRNSPSVARKLNAPMLTYRVSREPAAARPSAQVACIHDLLGDLRDVLHAAWQEQMIAENPEIPAGLFGVEDLDPWRAYFEGRDEEVTTE